MSRFIRGVRRAAQVLAITTPVLGIALGIWYRAHYVMPIYEEDAVSHAVLLPNGYDTILAAGKLLVKKHDGVEVNPWPKPTTPYSLSQRKAFVAANQPAINKLREGLAQEYLDQSGEHFNGTSQRALTRTLVFAAKTSADARDFPEASRYALDAIALSQQIPRGGGMMPEIIGNSCEPFGQKALWEIADKLDAKTARAAAARLAALEKTRLPLSATFQEEKRTVRSQFQPIFNGGPLAAWRNTGTYFGEVQATTSQLMKMMPGESAAEPEPETLADKFQWAKLRAQIVYYGPRTVAENMENWMDLVGRRSEQPWCNPRPVPPLPSDPLSQIILPVYGQLEIKCMLTRAQSQLLQGYLLLRAVRLETGHYPSPSEATTFLPSDPFSPTRAPLRYRRDSAEKITLWSVGPNATDEGGVQGKQEAGKEGMPGDLVAAQTTGERL